MWENWVERLVVVEELGKLGLKSLVPRRGTKMIRRRYKKTLPIAVPTVKQNLNLSWLFKNHFTCMLYSLSSLNFSLVR